MFGTVLPRDEWNAYDCIKGQDTLESALAEENLGKSTRHGFRNQTKEGDE